MIRTLAATSLLLVSGCTATGAPAAQASPTEPADQYAAACSFVAKVLDEQDLGFGAGTGPGMPATRSTDPGIRDAGRQLYWAGLEAERFLVENDPKADPGPANARLVEAQRRLLSACTDLFGPQPWPFAIRPSSSATS
ncbi:hypothetical protein [Micromonospora sp. KC721]|uniref:hypothetical protein n=1 Tax=Micromonospora sp. KC721 TaxID=2530380 RepID=UPI00104C8AD5|nr:hypothetical protein [Micromonospora sp. KC721]TDB80456.1 hypothetical protein E1182_08835 [Micromonospora sp. KC721]